MNVTATNRQVLQVGCKTIWEGDASLKYEGEGDFKGRGASLKYEVGGDFDEVWREEGGTSREALLYGCCKTYDSSIRVRLTTYVRVMHVRSCILTRNTMCKLLHNSVVHLVAKKESMWCPLCARLRRGRGRDVCTVCTMWKALQWLFNETGRLTVSNHLPSDKLESTNAWIRIMSTTPTLPLTTGSVWLCGSVASLSTKMLPMPFFRFWQIGMLGGGHGVCSICCCFFQVERAFPIFTFCFSRNVFSVGHARDTGPFFDFFFDGTISLKIVQVSFVFQISIKNAAFDPFRDTLEVTTRFATQLGAFAATNCLLSGCPSSESKFARRWYFETTHDVFENLFLDFNFLNEVSSWPSLSDDCSGTPGIRKSIWQLWACSLISRNGPPYAGSTYECIGSHRAVTIYGCTRSFVRVTSVTYEDLLSNRISVSELFRLNFRNFYHSFCRHDVKQNNRRTAGSIEFQSSKMCDLQIKYINCIKLWSAWGDIAFFGQWIIQWMHPWEEVCLSSCAIFGVSCEKTFLKDWSVIVGRSCMIDVSFQFIRNCK